MSKSTQKIRSQQSVGSSVAYVVGSGLAAYCSWLLNASVGWACVHALFGWIYILYLCAGFGGGMPPGVF